MRWPRFVNALSAVLIAFFATGALRLAHLEVAHSSPGAASACADACSTCPTCPNAPAAPSGEDDHPSSPKPASCATCLLLGVLTPDGLPVAAEPFFPIGPTVPVVSGEPRAITIAHHGVIPARGPPIAHA